MQVFGSAQQWWAQNVSGGRSDFASQAGKGAAIGGGVGAAVGAAAAAHNVLADQPYFDSVTHLTPRAELGPAATQVFGADTARLLELVRSRSGDTTSADDSLKYLAYLQNQTPATSPNDLTGIYNALENQLSDDTQVRSALNLITAHVAKHGSSPVEAFRQFVHHTQWETDFERAADSFARASKLGQDDLNEVSVELVQRHTTALGHLGLARGVLLGAGAGALTGALVGGAAGILIHVATSQ
ncbi:MAG: hypothetical protein AB7S38_12545 [Vulcanimicrobiota bacterium]